MSHSKGRRLLLAALIAALGVGAGCATPEPQQDPEQVKRSVAARDVGVDHLIKGRVALAIRQLTLATTLNPDDAEAQLWLGEAYRRKGKLEEAEFHIQESLRADPSLYRSHLQLSALYVQMERYEEAIAHCDALVDDPFFPQPWKALTNRGWAEYKLGRAAEARGSYLEALEYRFQYWPATLNLAILERESGHHLQAIQYFEEVVELELGHDPEAEANYRLGELYVSLGNRSKAISHFDAALSNSPRGNWGKQSRTYLELLR